jgi:polyferredoxin
VRPRIAVYAAVLGALSVAFLAALFLRAPLELDVIRDRNALYRESRPGYVENVYSLRVINKSHAPETYEVAVTGLPTLDLETDPEVIDVAAGELKIVAARVSIEDGAAPSGGHDIEFTLRATREDAATTEAARFFTP